MSADRSRLVAIPDSIGDDALNAIINSGEAVFRDFVQIFRRGDCFCIGHRRYARCAGCSPMYEGGLVFVHRVVLMTPVEAKALFGEGDPEEALRRRRDAERARAIAKRLEGFDV